MGRYWKVYRHTTPDGLVYIGMTSQDNMNARFQNGYGYRNCTRFYSAISKWGWENIKHEILATGLTKSDARKLESEYISKFSADDIRHGYNQSPGGYQMSKEIAHKISMAKRGKPNGKEGLVGELCDHVGVVRQIDETTGETVKEYFGYYDMARKTGYAKTPVREAAIGLRKRAYGYKWSYEKRGKEYVTI